MSSKAEFALEKKKQSTKKKTCLGRESNPCQHLGRVLFCHYTTKASEGIARPTIMNVLFRENDCAPMTAASLAVVQGYHQLQKLPNKR